MNWLTAARIAWREIAASRTKFLFVVFAIAVGVGSLAGVRGFGRAFRALLASEARTLMAADLTARVFEMPDQQQEALFAKLERQGVRRTWVTETVTMMGHERASYPVLVSVKAVDPAVYPFYGDLQLEPPAQLAAVLQPDKIAVSEDLLIRLDIKRGDTVKLGAAEFTITAVVLTEPDRMTGSLNVGPRVMVTREGLRRADLVKPGSRSAQRYLFRLGPGAPPIAQVREELKSALPSAMIADYRETHPLITRGLNRSERFLSLIGLIALIVGALGVAATIHAHLEQRLDSIAILKCIGARSGQVMRIYLVQTVLVGLAGGLIGALIGGAVQAAFPFLISEYFSLTPAFHWDWWASAEGIGVGLLTAILFTVPVLLSIRHVKPMVILRRDHEDRSRWYKAPGPWVAGAAIATGIAAVAGWLAGGDWTERAKVGGYFAGGLLASLLLLAGFSWVLLRVLRGAVSTRGVRWPMNIRHGVANIYRPGNQAEAVLVSLGLGVMFTLTVFLIQRGLLSQLVASAPPNMPNVFLINITSRERADVESLLKQHGGIIQGKPEVVAMTAARLDTVNGVPVKSMILRGASRRFGSSRSVTWAEEARPGSDIVAGAWWSASAGTARPNQVCVLEDTARDLGVKPGVRMVWTAGLRTIDATVACVYKTEEVRMGGNMDFVFSPGTLDKLPVQYFAAVRMKPPDVAGFQKASFAKLPSVVVINGADVLDIIQGVVDQIALVVRFISAFAILAGIIILASSIASTRFRRAREVAVLKTLGARRARVARIFSVEFFILGGLAGVLGVLLANVFSGVLLIRLLDAKFKFDLWPNLIAAATAAMVANLAGWLASWRILGEKPLRVLRDE
jgi:putative ABC transport system permease protein